ncbi:hypothetical protein [uncultured Varibaculum sp.]|nr:hypothetical protein [uncultured Varibaculum sp.]
MRLPAQLGHADFGPVFGGIPLGQPESDFYWLKQVSVDVVPGTEWKP